MDDILKGNFKVKNPVTMDPDDSQKPEEAHSGAKKIAKELREHVLASLGGSMVYVDRERLTWDGDEDAGS